jgi:hypothetical protein
MARREILGDENHSVAVAVFSVVVLLKRENLIPSEVESGIAYHTGTGTGMISST